MSPSRDPLFFFVISLVVPIWDHEFDRLASIDVGDADVRVLLCCHIPQRVDVIVVARIFRQYRVHRLSGFHLVLDDFGWLLCAHIETHKDDHGKDDPKNRFSFFHD